MIDTHCHLTNDRYDEAEALIKEAEQNGIKRLVTIGVDLKDSKKVCDLSEKYHMVSGAVGVHPLDVCEEGVPSLEALYELGRHPQVVALGETGFDFYHGSLDTFAQQELSFQRHVEVAHDLNKALVIHARDAWEPTQKFLKQAKQKYPNLRTVMHCFTGNLEQAFWFIEHCDSFISFSGIVTFPKKAEEIQKAAEGIPLKHLLCETDAPYLAPNPIRGQINKPYAVQHVYEKIAQMRNIPLQSLVEQVELNAEDLFCFEGGK